MPAAGQAPRTCGDIASELEISEHEVFIRAFRWYYGEAPMDVDSAFGEYIQSGCEAIPHYVQQFTRIWQPGVLAA